MTRKEFETEWKKEIRRIKRFIQRASKRGYVFDYEPPEMPKGIAPKKLEELRTETTAPKMYKRAKYYPNKNGKNAMTGTQGRKHERKMAARKGQLTKKQNQYEKWKQQRYYEMLNEPIPRYSNVVLENLREFLTEHTHLRPVTENRHWKELAILRNESANSLLELLTGYIATEGERKVGLRLETRAEELNQLMVDFEMASSQKPLNEATVRIATIIKGGSLTLEESEYYTTISEEMQWVESM